MGAQTINDIFYTAIERNSDRVMLFKQTVKWIPISSSELYRDVLGTAHSLANWGIHKGDRVAILSENRPEWAIADFATMLLGAVVVPIYPTLTAEQIASLLHDSGARIIFLSSVGQLNKFREIKDQTAIEKIVLMDYAQVADVIPMQRLMQEGPTTRDSELDARARAISPDDIATIVYTSGTTGTPKGALLSHSNLTSDVQSDSDRWKNYFQPGHAYISFLPLSHITARHVDYLNFYLGVTIAYCPFLDKLPETLLEVRPATFVGVPRVFEKVRAQVEAKASGGLKHLIYDWAMRVGRAHREQILAGKTPADWQWKLADKLLYGKVRAGIGGNVRYLVSGGAPLSREVAEWYADIGIRIHEGYGLTETSPVIAVNSPDAHKLGTVGKLLPNVQVRIAEDGEILVKGPTVFHGYWNMPQETREAFTDGWFKTGDIGNIDADGFLSITDRKKDLIKTSGGKFIAPQPLEGSLKMNPLIAEAAIIGEKRKFPAVVICPNFAALEDWARARNISFRNREELISNAQVRHLYEEILYQLNAGLAQFQKIKKFLLVPDDFTIANGLLTPTMKLRRRVLEDRYLRQIDQLYADPALPETEATQVR